MLVKTFFTYLRPGQSVIKVVFHLVVFGQAQQVTVLHVHQIVCLCYVGLVITNCEINKIIYRSVSDVHLDRRLVTLYSNY